MKNLIKVLLLTGAISFATSVFSQSEPCVKDHIIDAHKDTNINLEAEHTITSNATAFPNENIEYSAGTSVKLMIGFKAKSGSSFKARMGACVPQLDKHKTGQNNEIQLSNYPNPFTGETTIEFVLPKNSPVTLYVSDAMGRTIEVLLDNENKQSGINSITFDGNRYPAGMYYYSIQANEYFGAQKMLIIK